MNPLEIPEILRRVTSDPPQVLYRFLDTWLPRSYRNQIHDLSPLARRDSLGHTITLDLAITQVSDLGPSIGLANSQRLELRRTQVSDEQVAALQAALPNLEIIR